MSTKAIRDRRVRVYFWLLRFHHVLTRHVEVEFGKVDSNYMRMLIMNALYTNGGSLSPTELSKYVYRTRHSVTSMIDTLEKQKLVRREPNPEDRRSVTITMTTEGRILFEKMMPVGYRLSNKALADFNNEDMDQLVALLTKLKVRMLALMNDNNEY